jgi:hypothetical protein
VNWNSKVFPFSAPTTLIHEAASAGKEKAPHLVSSAFYRWMRFSIICIKKAMEGTLLKDGKKITG